MVWLRHASKIWQHNRCYQADAVLCLYIWFSS